MTIQNSDWVFEPSDPATSGEGVFEWKRAFSRMGLQDRRLYRAFAASLLFHGFLICFGLFATELPAHPPEHLIQSKSRLDELLFRDTLPTAVVPKASDLRQSPPSAKPLARAAHKRSSKGWSRKAKPDLNLSAESISQDVEKVLIRQLMNQNLLATAKQWNTPFPNGLKSQRWMQSLPHSRKSGEGNSSFVLLNKGGGGGWHSMRGRSFRSGLEGCQSPPCRHGHSSRRDHLLSRHRQSSRWKKKRKYKIRVSSGVHRLQPLGLHREIIRRVIQKHRSQFRYCYEYLLNQNKRLRGVVHVSFQINLTGSVQRVQIKRNTSQSSHLADCISKRVRTLRFPRPAGAIVQVNYPFVFQTSLQP